MKTLSSVSQRTVLSSQNSASLFNVPELKLRRLSFSAVDGTALRQWVELLPVADRRACTRLLYIAITELNQLQLGLKPRLQALQILHPAIEFACQRLSRPQSGVVSAIDGQAASVSQALREHLAKAYLRCILQCEDKMGGFLSNPAPLLAQAINAALVEYRHILLSNYRLYRPSTTGFWLKVHHLYQLAQHYPLPIKERRTIDNNYRQLLLWGCIKANQLHKDDIQLLLRYMPDWADQIVLEACDAVTPSTFILDPWRDMPPVYAKFYGQTAHFLAPHPAVRSMQTMALLAQLKEMADRKSVV